MTVAVNSFISVYGPVQSWRFGRSLGVDPIGPISTCSFNCVYCQLGDIQAKTAERQVFVPTEQVARDLEAFAPWDVDVVTFSGNGEPTQARNLGALLAIAREITQRPTVVLTNSTFLGEAAVREALAPANYVAAKLDAVWPERWQGVNRPVAGLDLAGILAGLHAFRQGYRGHLALQTMLLSPWSEEQQADYIACVRDLQPDEIQLNTPTRPRPLAPHPEARGLETERVDFPVQPLKAVSPEHLRAFAEHIQRQTQIPVRCAPVISSAVPLLS
jgi:wyosine [tRNA(Phe)-imidazoG37] synthetase (radical SAM superfamily)